MKAILLAAGYATRLYPLTKDRPKPLLEVADKPIADYILEDIMAIDGMDQCFVVTNNKFYPHFLEWQKDHPFQDQLVILNDGTKNAEDRLGAIGDLDFVLKDQNLDDDLLVIAGDNLFDLSLPKLMDFAKSKKNPVICVKDLSHKSELLPQYGIVSLDEEHRVIDFEEKPAHPKSSYIAIGIYFFPRADISYLNRYVEEGENPDAPGFFIQWLHKKTSVYGFVFKEEWYDIGDLESLEEANKLYKSKQNS